MTNKQIKKPICIDLCEHCIYIDTGDFICDIKKEITIKNWIPSICLCPKKRRVEE